MSKTKEVRPFGLRDKIGYMCGDLANDFSFIFASSYVMVFYTKVMGISAGMVGTMFLVARCLDAFTDIGMGRIVDNSKPTKNGRIRPWILRMCAFVALASFMMYQSFLVDASYGAKVAYMFITYILWGSIFYTSINIPYGSMASVISAEPKDRSSLSVFRSMGGGVAGIMIGIMAPMLVYHTDAQGNQVVSASRISVVAGVFSVIAIICYLLCYTLTTERVAYVPKPASEKKSTAETLKTLFTSRALLGLVLSAVLLLLASLMGQGINTYLFADYFKNTKALSVFALLMLPCMIVLAGISTKRATKFGKRECSMVGMFVSGILYFIIGCLHIKNVWAFVGMVFVAMLGMYFFQMQCWALVTDVIDDMEVQTRNRDDGTIYGIYSFSRKIGQAIAGGLSGWALGWIGYDELAAGQTEAVANGIYNLATFFPAVIYILCGLVLMFIFPLNKARVDANVAELKKRREAAN